MRLLPVLLLPVLLAPLLFGCSSPSPRKGTIAAAPAVSQSVSNTPVESSQARRRSGPDSPPKSDPISWTGTAQDAQGKTVATIEVDTADVPELADWGRHAGELCAQWYPKIAVLLGVEGDLRADRKIELWFRKDMSGVANTSPREGLIRISASYVKAHTNDWGMPIHELVHTIQSFGGRSGPPPAFSADDIKDASGLAARLREHSDAVSQFVWGALSEEGRQAVMAAASADSAGKAFPALLAKELSAIARTNNLYLEARFATVNLSETTKGMAGEDLEGGRLVRFNRLLLEDAYPEDIAKRRGGRGGANGSWLTEGIADYIRLAHFEPEAPLPRPINPDKAKYTDSYKTTATFFRWIEKNYDKDLVRKINLALRDGKYKIEIFKDFTGKTIDELWSEFADSLRKEQNKAVTAT